MTDADAYGEIAAQQMTFRHERGHGTPRAMITVSVVGEHNSVAGLLQRAGAEIMASRRPVEAKCELTATQAAALAAFRDCNGDTNQLDVRCGSIRYARGTDPPLDRWNERQRQAGSEL